MPRLPLRNIITITPDMSIIGRIVMALRRPPGVTSGRTGGS